jgi:hypothetical protein
MCSLCHAFCSLDNRSKAASAGTKSVKGPGPLTVGRHPTFCVIERCQADSAGQFHNIRDGITVAGFSWERKVLLEHFAWVQETSYTGFPAGSRNHHSTTEQYQSYEVVRHDTRTTVVNGTTTTTTQPVYGFVSHTRRKYTYEIQKWAKSRELLAEGEERATLHWPAYTLDRSTQERVKSVQEKYLVHFQSAKGKKYRQTLPEAEWTALDDQSTYTLKMSVFGHITHISPSTQQLAQMARQTP